MDREYELYKASKLVCQGYIDNKEYLKAIVTCNEIIDRYPCRERKYRKLIQDLEELCEDHKDGIVYLENGFFISRIIYDKLDTHQKDAINFLWSLHQKNKGGVLGDDHGFRNTVAFVAFMSGLFDMEAIKNVLIVTNALKISKWEDEFRKWCPALKVSVYKPSKKDLRNVMKEVKVLLVSFQNFVNSSSEKPLGSTAKCAFTSITWDYVLFDNGHRTQNDNKTSRAAFEIPATHKIIRADFPIQNRVGELWIAYHICYEGKLLPSRSEFNNLYEIPIKKGLEENASSDAKEYGLVQAERLRKLIEPYFLRRTKEASLPPPPKIDFVIWVYLSDIQIQIYQRYLQSEDVKKIMNSRKATSCSQMNILRNICDHPRLFTQKERADLDMEASFNEAIEDSLADTESIEPDPNVLLKESGKLETLFLLLENLIETGHRILVFANRLKALDIIEKILHHKRWPFIRVDGTIREEKKRKDLTGKFQSNNKYHVMLLTSQLGNTDLDLTAADRVVIYDPSWNNVTDEKAVKCAYKNGQTKSVFVYRLISCGTIEEKIYGKQIMKDSITSQFSGQTKPYKDPHRLFKKEELNEFWVLDNPKESKTYSKLAKLGKSNRKTTLDLDEHVAFLLSLKTIVYNISDHDLAFRGQIEDQLADTASAANANYIQNPVETAEERIQDQFENTSIPSASATKTTGTPSPRRRKNKGETDRYGDQRKDHYLLSVPCNDDYRGLQFEKTFRHVAIEEEIIREPLSEIARNSLERNCLGASAYSPGRDMNVTVPFEQPAYSPGCDMNLTIPFDLPAYSPGCDTNVTVPFERPAYSPGCDTNQTIKMVSDESFEKCTKRRRSMHGLPRLFYDSDDESDED